MSLASIFAPDGIPIDVLARQNKYLPEPLSTALSRAEEFGLAVDELLEPLARFSFIKRDLHTKTFSVHRLVQAVQQGLLSPDERRAWAEIAVLVLDAEFPDATDSTKWSTCEHLLPHALACYQTIRQHKTCFQQAGTLLDKVGLYLSERADYKAAEEVLTACCHNPRPAQGNQPGRICLRNEQYRQPLPQLGKVR